MMVKRSAVTERRGGIRPAVEDVVEARDPDRASLVLHLDRLIDEQFDAVTSVGTGELPGRDTAAVFPVAKDGKHPRRARKISQQPVEQRERSGPIDRIARDHDEVGLRLVELLEQLTFERTDAAHVQVADLYDAKPVGRSGLSKGVGARHEPPWRDCHAIDRGRERHRAGDEAGPPEQRAAAQE